MLLMMVLMMPLHVGDYHRYPMHLLTHHLIIYLMMVPSLVLITSCIPLPLHDVVLIMVVDTMTYTVSNDVYDGADYYYLLMVCAANSIPYVMM